MQIKYTVLYVIGKNDIKMMERKIANTNISNNFSVTYVTLVSNVWKLLLIFFRRANIWGPSLDWITIGETPDIFLVDAGLDSWSGSFGCRCFSQLTSGVVGRDKLPRTCVRIQLISKEIMKSKQKVQKYDSAKNSRKLT